jgi:hypothetical protein
MKGDMSFPGWRMMTGMVAAFGLGFWVAQGSGGGNERRDGSWNGSNLRPDGDSREGGSSKAHRGKPWQDAKARVLQRWEASPAVLVDFDLREETLRLLEKTPVADLEVWMRELRPLVQTDYDKDIPALLREMIAKVLIERCGGEFVRSLDRNPLEDGDYDLEDLMNHWTRHDPIAVLEWLDEGNLPEEIEQDIESYMEDALVDLSGKDPEEFERRLSAMDSDTRESVLDDYAYRRASAEYRAELLERAARSPHGEALALYRGLTRREAANDLTRAIATLQEIGISAADRATMDDGLVSGFMDDSDGLVEDTSRAMQGWVERNPERGAPGELLEAFGNWTQSHPEKAGDWVAKQPSGLQYDAFARQWIEERAHSRDRDLAQAIGIAARISDPDIRAEANRLMKEAWQPYDAATAAEWERNLPAGDRERLSRDLPANER